jgi:hypothetical protein
MCYCISIIVYLFLLHYMHTCYLFVCYFKMCYLQTVWRFQHENRWMFFLKIRYLPTIWRFRHENRWMVSFLFCFILLSRTESLVYPTADHAPIFSSREYRSMHDHTLQWRVSEHQPFAGYRRFRNDRIVLYIVYTLRRYQFTI